MNNQEKREYASLSPSLQESYMSLKLKYPLLKHRDIMDSIGVCKMEIVRESYPWKSETTQSKLRQNEMDEYQKLSHRERYLYDFEKNAHPDKDHQFYMNTVKLNLKMGMEIFNEEYEGSLEDMQYSSLSPQAQKYYDLQREMYPNKDHNYYMHRVELQIKIEKMLSRGEDIGTEEWLDIIKGLDRWSKRNFPNYYKKMEPAFKTILAKLNDLLKVGIRVVKDIWEWLKDLFS